MRRLLAALLLATGPALAFGSFPAAPDPDDFGGALPDPRHQSRVQHCLSGDTPARACHDRLTGHSDCVTLAADPEAVAACLRAEAAAWDAALLALEPGVRERAAASARGAESLALFAAAQDGFRAWRRARCRDAAGAWRPGSPESLASEARCLIATTVDRVADLQVWGLP
jgi:uncharacterized protein YecT (DUF1311 family)